MGRLLIGTGWLGAALLAVASPLWAANSVDAGVDIRGVASDGGQSYLNGGLGELRFDAKHDGLRLGSAWLHYRGDYSGGLHASVDAVSYADQDRLPVDLTQAYLEYRPFPAGLWRSRVRLGAFYAPLSLENRLTGWRSPYTLSFSAINTWIGEELRTLGAEYDVDWLGRQGGHAWQLGASASLYGFNDIAGTLLALRGWSLNDRQTTLFGRIGEPHRGPVHGLREFYGNFDGRPGYYVGVNAAYREALELRALHYDNLADPAAHSRALQEFAWRTHFDGVSAAWLPSDSWTVVSQWLGGWTCAATRPSCWQFSSAFLLASWQHHAERLSARYDTFQLHAHGPVPTLFANLNRGHAWTVALAHEFNAHLSLVAEALWIDSLLSDRSRIGEPPELRERELQLALRAQL